MNIDRTPEARYGISEPEDYEKTDDAPRKEFLLRHLRLALRRLDKGTAPEKETCHMITG